MFGTLWQSLQEVSLQNWLLALSVTIVLFLGIVTFKRLLLNRLEKLARRIQTPYDDLVIGVVKQTKIFFIFLMSLYAGWLLLPLPEDLRASAHTIALMVVLLQIGFWGNGVISGLLSVQIKQRIASNETEQATDLSAFRLILQGVFWVIIGLMILDNIPNVEVNSLVASLGIGGIAVALAAQNILGDLFASLAIALDKPFVIGDVIVLGEDTGTVEKIGLKSTRIRMLSGEQLIVSNTDLLNSRIRNFRRMQRRRILFTIGVTYDTPVEQVKQIPIIIQEIVKEQPLATFDRSHFTSFGDSALMFDTVYYVESADFLPYMDTQHQINLGIMEKFEAEQIDFAFPTRTIIHQGTTEKSSPTS